MSKELMDALRAALDAAPASDRRIALYADVDPSLLSRIRAGNRSATRAVVAAVVDALERLGDECQGASETLQQALDAEGEL